MAFLDEIMRLLTMMGDMSLEGDKLSSASDGGVMRIRDESRDIDKSRGESEKYIKKPTITRCSWFKRNIQCLQGCDFS